VDVLVLSADVRQRDAVARVARAAFPQAGVRQVKGIADALALIRVLPPRDLVLLDLAIGGTASIAALQQLREHDAGRRVVAFCSKSEDRALILAALDAGAVGYLSKQCPANVKAAALVLVAEGGNYLPAEILPRQIRIPITARQRDVLRLLLRGYSNERIASELSISESTVKQHAHAVFDAFGVSSRAQLLATARNRGIRAE
jgi:DNA-binding NarL/FixJ family response regulator